MIQKSFHQELREIMDDYAHSVYRVSKHFPQDERYGITSQLRRSALSVILNYIEGYARLTTKQNKHFLEIAHGSLKESRYLIDFCYEEGYMISIEHDKLIQKADRIGKMLWGIIRKI